MLPAGQGEIGWLTKRKPLFAFDFSFYVSISSSASKSFKTYGWERRGELVGLLISIVPYKSNISRYSGQNWKIFIWLYIEGNKFRVVCHRT